MSIRSVVFEKNVPKGANLFPIETPNTKFVEDPENQIESPLKLVATFMSNNFKCK